MKYFKLLNLLLLCLSPFAHAADITVTPTLDPISQAAEQADDTTLFIFDVDDVLVMPSDQILWASHKKDAIEYEDNYRKNYSQKKCHHLWSIARKALNPRVMDPKILELFSRLHQKHIKTIALTNAGTGRFGTIPRLEDLRIQELQGLDLDFRGAFAIKKYIKFYTLQSQADQKRLPMFKEGILFTCNVPKGKVLEAFLKRIKWKPSKIIFTDDKMKNVESVRDFCQRTHISFQGFQYTAMENMPKIPLNKTRADLQFKTLAEQEKWLSDAEADQVLGDDVLA